MHPNVSEAFMETLKRIGLADLLDGFIAPEQVRRIGFNDLEFFARENGYAFEREFGNVYSCIRLVSLKPAAPASILGVITRSDHAAVYGSRREA